MEFPRAWRLVRYEEVADSKNSWRQEAVHGRQHRIGCAVPSRINLTSHRQP
jgi:hypothetical protein